MKCAACKFVGKFGVVNDASQLVTFHVCPNCGTVKVNVDPPKKGKKKK